MADEKRITASEIVSRFGGADFGTFSARLHAPGLEDDPVLAASPFLRTLAERELEILKRFGYVAQDATLDSLKAN